MYIHTMNPVMKVSFSSLEAKRWYQRWQLCGGFKLRDITTATILAKACLREGSEEGEGEGKGG